MTRQNPITAWPLSTNRLSSSSTASSQYKVSSPAPCTLFGLPPGVASGMSPRGPGDSISNISPRRISGVAIRYCVELGYHRSVNRYRKQTNPLVAEMSKRCFWVAYDIDRVASFILGRPVGIPDDCIDAEVCFYTQLPNMANRN